MEETDVAQEFVDERRGRIVVDFGRRACLFDLALIHDGHAVGDFEGFFLVVSHEDAGYVKFVVQAAEPAAEFLADLAAVERSEGFIEQEDSRLERPERGPGSATRCLWPPES